MSTEVVKVAVTFPDPTVSVMGVRGPRGFDGPAASVKTYGAVGDGVANDTAAIHLAIAAAVASTTTRTVFFPPGSYKCNLVLQSRVHLLGAGSLLGFTMPGATTATTKLIPNNNALPVISIPAGYVDGQRISDLSIVGNGAGTSVCGIRLGEGATEWNGQAFGLDDCEIVGFTTGLEARGIASSVALRTQFKNNTTAVVLGGLTSPVICDGWVFNACDFAAEDIYNAAGACKAFHVTAGRGLQIVGGAIYWLANVGDFGQGTMAEISCCELELFNGQYLIGVREGARVTLRSSNVQTASTAVLFRDLDGNGFGVVENSTVDCKDSAVAGFGNILVETASDVHGRFFARLDHQILGCIRYTTDGTWATTRRHELFPTQQSYPRHSAIAIADEFVRTGAADDYGDLGWSVVQVSGSGALIQGATDFGPPYEFGGQIRFVSATNPSVQSLSLSGTSRLFYAGALWTVGTHPFDMEFRAKSLGLTNQTLLIGIPSAPASALPSSGIWFRHDSAVGGNWLAECRNGGVTTSVDTGVAATTSAFRKFRIRIVAATSVVFTIDGGAETVITTNLPTAVDLIGPMILAGLSGAGLCGAELDYFRLTSAWQR